MRWLIRWPELYPIDILVIARADRFAANFVDFFVLPKGSLGPQKLTELTEKSALHLEMFRFSELKILLELTARAPVEVPNGPRNAPDNNRSD